MKNAHFRFGWLTYVKSTEKTTTSIKLHLDRFIGEILPDPPRQAKAHHLCDRRGHSNCGGRCGDLAGNRFMVEGPDVQPIRVCLERNARCFKGSVQLAGRKKPLRHLVGLSEELANTNVSASSGRTLLGASDSQFRYGPLWLTSTEFQECQNRQTGLLVNSALTRPSFGRSVWLQSGIGQRRERTVSRLAQLGR